MRGAQVELAAKQFLRQLEIDEFLSPSERHHSIGDEELYANSAVPPWVKTACRAEANAAWAEAEGRALDAVRRELAVAEAAYGMVFADYRIKLRADQERLGESQSQLQQQWAELTSLEQKYAEKSAEAEGSGKHAEKAAEAEQFRLTAECNCRNTCGEAEIAGCREELARHVAQVEQTSGPGCGAAGRVGGPLRPKAAAAATARRCRGRVGAGPPADRGHARANRRPQRADRRHERADRRGQERSVARQAALDEKTGELAACQAELAGKGEELSAWQEKASQRESRLAERDCQAAWLQQELDVPGEVELAGLRRQRGLVDRELARRELCSRDRSRAWRCFARGRRRFPRRGAGESIAGRHSLRAAAKRTAMLLWEKLHAAIPPRRRRRGAPPAPQGPPAGLGTVRSGILPGAQPRRRDARAGPRGAFPGFRGQRGNAAPALFDMTCYLQHNADVAAARINPLEHYLQCGAAEDRDPHPLFDTSGYRRRTPTWPHPARTRWAIILCHGATEGRRPHPLFDTAYYLRENPDVAAAGVNPLQHYLEHGAAEGRKPNPLFDSAYYLRENPDVAATGVNPLQHYLEHGAGEGRKPNPFFDSATTSARIPRWPPTASTRSCTSSRSAPRKAAILPPSFETGWYLRENADVAAAGVNPLAHYLDFGQAEGRAPSPAVVRPPLPPFPDGPVFFPKVEKPHVSIVLPVRNHWPYTLASLHAIRANSGDALEVILADDGSTDETREAQSLAKTCRFPLGRRPGQPPAGTVAQLQPRRRPGAGQIPGLRPTRRHRPAGMARCLGRLGRARRDGGDRGRHDPRGRRTAPPGRGDRLGRCLADGLRRR